MNQTELDAAIESYKAMGFDVVRANENTLLLDIDNDYALAQFERVFPIVQEHYGAVVKARWPSKSGNTHIQIEVPTMPWAMRYALEAMLGSDGIRGVLGMLQMQNGCDEASMLVKPLPNQQREYVNESQP